MSDTLPSAAPAGAVGFGTDDQPDTATGYPKSLKEVRLAHQILVGLGIAGLVFILLFALFGARKGAGLTMLAWGFTAALASLASGLIVGLLFGLPNVRRVEIADGDQSNDSGVRSARLGYAESTNLEQVADWLTKIIIGLTLTQFALWEERFTQLSYDLSCFLLGGGCSMVAMARDGTVLYPPGSTVPGGFLMIFYAVLGFLIGYMWMRGYFISEMETAKANAVMLASADLIRNAREKARLAIAEATAAKARADEDIRRIQEAAALEAQTIRQQADAAKLEFERQLEEARRAGLAQSRPEEVTAASVQAVAESAVAIAKTAAVVAPEGAATDGAAEVRKKLTNLRYPDDPWRDAFGGSATVRGYTLKGVVKPREDSSDYFDVELAVDADLAQEPDAPGKSVQFFLHPTFGKDAARSVSFNQAGVAPLSPLMAYGAFTVGALVEDGTLLELNLATVKGVPDRFLSR